MGVYWRAPDFSSINSPSEMDICLAGLALIVAQTTRGRWHRSAMRWEAIRVDTKEFSAQIPPPRVCVFVSLTLFFSLSFSLSVCLSVSVSVSLSLSQSLSVCLSPSLSLFCQIYFFTVWSEIMNCKCILKMYV